MTSSTLPIGILAALSIVCGLPRACFGQTDPKASADEHFKRGVEFFRDRRFGDAATEFEEAYRLSPAYVVLYNIGQVNAALGRSVEAVDAYEQYLKQGAAEISPERTREVQAELSKQRDRIGTVVVRTEPEGAEIRMDGRWLGRTPLRGPVRVTIGHHVFEATLSGYVSQVHEVEVVGRAERTLAITLVVDPAVALKDQEARDAEARAKAAQAQAAEATAHPAAAPPVVTLLEVPRNEPPARSGAAPAGERAAALGSSINWQRVIGYVVAIGGLGTATVGGVLAYQGANEMNDANARLAKEPTQMAYDLALSDYYNADYADGQHRNRLGWIIAGIGGAAFIGGIVLAATSPERPSGSVALSLAPIAFGPSGAVSLFGVF